MNEGYDRKNNQNTPTSVSDLFGSHFENKSEKSVFLNVAKHGNFGYWRPENEILEVEEEDGVNKDGNLTKVNVYV
eukprot:UN13364